MTNVMIVILWICFNLDPMPNQTTKNFLQLLTEAVSEAMLVVNKDQIIVSVNTPLLELFDYTKSDLIGTSLHRLLPKSAREGHQRQVSGFLAQSSARTMAQGRQLYGCKRHGDYFPIEVGLKPFSYEGKEYVLGLVRDTSVQLEQVQRMHDTNVRLEEMVSERTLELNDTINALKREVGLRKAAEEQANNALKQERELNELKTKFLSLVSHEFKTPLSTILSSATLIGRYNESEQQERREHHINTISEKVKYLDTILNDFLSLERLETGKVSYKMDFFDSCATLNRVLLQSKNQLKAGQHFLLDIPKTLSIYFDEKILALALTNLIQNAIKYAPEDSEIKVNIKEDEGHFYLTVMDRGIGIPEAEQKFIFDRYFRAENALTHKGTGIGLNIAKSHLNQLGGNLTFQSREGAGSTFVITIPKNTTL